MPEDATRSLGIYGAGWQFEAMGATWTLLPVPQKIKSAFASLIKKDVIQSAVSLKGGLLPSDYKELLAAANDDCASGNYEWGEAGWRKWLRTANGTCQLTCLLLQLRHPEVTFEKTQDIIEANPDGWKMAFLEVLRDPNFQMPPGRMTGAN